MRRGERAAPEDGPSVDAPALAGAIERLEEGADYKTVLEELLRELAEADASRLDLFLRESRGAWLLCARAAGGRALLAGDALSGTAVALSRLGFDVTLLDRSPDRLRYALARNRVLGRRAAGAVLAGRGGLPFRSGAFDLVVLEGGLPGAGRPIEHELEEFRRVAGGELALTADNRLGYKRSTGHRGDFRVPGAGEYLRSALRPPRGRRTLFGYRAALAHGDFERARAFALYPHARDFALVARCEGDPRRSEGPRLSLGPKERRNRLKMLGYRAGLFPVLTSSFALLTARRGRGASGSRLERLLSALAERVGEPVPDAEHLVATRGNSAVVLTAVPGRGEEDPRGRWAVHVPLSPRQELRVRRNLRRLEEIGARFPDFPRAEPLFAGEIEGAWVSCQRRLPGITAPQISGEHERVERMVRDVGRRLAEVVAEPAALLDEPAFERLVGARFDLVRSFATPRAVRDELDRLRAKAAELLVGTRVPLVLYHADLRSKHVQVRPDGSLVALLDWGSSERADLPYFDLLNLLVHERQHEQGLTGAGAWAVFRERRSRGPLAPREHERRAVDAYARALELEERYLRGIEAIFPVLVGGMAEKHWDFSRPRWLQRLYGLGPA